MPQKSSCLKFEIFILSSLNVTIRQTLINSQTYLLLPETKLITLSSSLSIREFILKLQEDYEFLQQFNKDPDKVMNETGIKSKEIRNILKSRDLLKIDQLLSKYE